MLAARMAGRYVVCELKVPYTIVANLILGKSALHPTGIKTYHTNFDPLLPLMCMALFQQTS